MQDFFKFCFCIVIFNIFWSDSSGDEKFDLYYPGEDLQKQLYGSQKYKDNAYENVVNYLESKISEATTSSPSTEIPTYDRQLQIFRQRCLNVSGEDTFEEYQGALSSYKTCITSLFSGSDVKKDLLGQKTGNLREIVKSYCQKRSGFNTCLDQVFNPLIRCLDGREQTIHLNLRQIMRDFVEYACFKGGLRMVLFVGENGLECLGTIYEEIYACYDRTIQHFFTAPDILTPFTPYARLVSGDQGCIAFHNFHECVFNAMDNCTDSTPGEILESAFEYVERKTPCAHTEREEVNLVTSDTVGSPNGNWLAAIATASSIILFAKWCSVHLYLGRGVILE